VRDRKAEVSCQFLDPTPSFGFSIGCIHLPDGSTKLLVSALVFRILSGVVAI